MQKSENPIRIAKVRMHIIVSGILLFSTVAIGTVYLYTYFLLISAGVAWESIFPTFVFIAMFVASSILVVCTWKREWGFVTWAGKLVVFVFELMFWNWFRLFLRDVKFPGQAVQNYIWGGFLLLAFSLLIVELVLSIPALDRRCGSGFSLKVVFPRDRQESPAKTIAAIAIPAILLAMAYPAAQLAAQPRVTREFTTVDANANCEFAIWDCPQFTAQVGNTTDINLGSLATNQTRLLVALGRMNTTFFATLQMGTATGINYTIAYLKMLAAYNLTFCWNIGYSYGFITPEHPEEWIANARGVLEFCIAHDLRNVVGITADAEGSSNLSPAEYWANIAMYEGFLQEIKDNATLAHPDPARGTFDSILTVFEAQADDLVDGDSDNTYREGSLGIPPLGWTKRHYMMYRCLTSPERAPVWLYNYLNILKNTQGTTNIAPIVGVTGCDWFCEGWLSDPDHGNCTDYGRGHAGSVYDGVDGWAAMKREILLCKAFGFDQVSVFHLNADINLDHPVIEEHGLLDYYGIDKIEELADEWVAGGSVITIPLSTFRFQTSSDDFFANHGLVVNDVYYNEETTVALIAIAVAVVLVSIYVAKHPHKN
nr:hypothetical protein [Candidatus Sigynarchaeota archaeon]